MATDKATTLPKTPPPRRGPRTFFPNKVRTPIALQLPAELHVLLTTHAARCHVRRGDFVCMCLEQFAASVTPRTETTTTTTTTATPTGEPTP